MMNLNQSEVNLIITNHDNNYEKCRILSIIV